MVHTTATTLHLYYDLEKPGYRGILLTSKFLLKIIFVLGYDRRHYRENHRFAFSECIFKPTDHDSVPSSPSSNIDEQWRPHGRHIEPMYTKYVCR
jgi:hypothetical protein